MATKSKKSIIIKAVCFLLAVAFVFTGFLTSYNFIVNVAQTENGNSYAYDNADAYITDYFRFGRDFKLTESDLFDREKEQFISTAVYSSVVFGDGSEKAYEAYRESLKEAAKNSIVSDLQGLSYYSFFDRYFQGCFRLEKISDCSLKYHGLLFDYVEGCFIDEENQYFDDEVATTYVPDDGVTSPAVPTTFSETYYRDDETGSHNCIETALPASLKTKLPENSDANVYICNAQCDGEYFDGWYALTVNAENAVDYLSGHGHSEFENYDSYSYFSNSAQQEKAELNKYKNMYFALFNKKTGEVFTNLPEKLDEETVEDVFRSYGYYASYDFGSGEWENGRYVPEQNQPVISFSFYDNMINETLLGGYKMYLAFDETFSGGADAFSTIATSYYNGFSTMANSAFAVVIICLLGFIACTVVLVVTAGRNGIDGQVHMMKTDKIFTLLRIAINGGLICGLVWLGILLVSFAIDENCIGFFDKNQPGAFLLSLLAGLIAALFVDLLMYLSRHIKNRSLIKNLFVVWLGRKLIKRINAFKQKIAERPAVYRDIFNDVLRKAVLWFLIPNAAGVILCLFFFAVDFGLLNALPVLALVGYDIFCIVYAVRYFYTLRVIFRAINEIRKGNYDITIDTRNMQGSVKAYAEDVNALRDGLKVAVEKAIRDERTKTELITNVSHDLKTPLTSIITYVDLLSRCDIQDETAKGYIEVLGEKSARLKKLIEDLVEASKASTGSINVQLIKVSLNELARQLSGEYEDEFENRRLRLVLTQEDGEVFVLADSKLCYRVLDNLFGNIKKYAMPGTRVYVTVSRRESAGVITLRNISESELNIPASELMSRFVRGDESRSSEGSGLGLSIAQSLTELQGGKLTIDISGDMFTATVEFGSAD